MPALNPISEDVAQRLLVEVTGRADAWQAWTQDGNLHVDLLSWLWTGLGGESGIGTMIQADFEITFIMKERSTASQTGGG